MVRKWKRIDEVQWIADARARQTYYILKSAHDFYGELKNGNHYYLWLNEYRENWMSGELLARTYIGNFKSLAVAKAMADLHEDL